MCKVGESGLNLLQESMTAPGTLKILCELSKTHPKLFEQLTMDEITPHTYTKAKVSKPKIAQSLKQKAKAEVAPVDDNDNDEPAFSPDFDDSCDIPLEALVEHIITKEPVEGLELCDNGSLQHSINETPDNAEENTALGQFTAKLVTQSWSGHILWSSVWYQKDWIYTADSDQ